MKAAFLLFSVLALSAAHAHAETRVLVRGFIWGVGKEDVRQFEPATFWEETPERMRFFEGGNGNDGTDVYDVRRVIGYDFDENGGLWRIIYDYPDLAPPNPQVVIDLYDKEKRHLSALYGAPDSENLEWKNKRYRSLPDFWPRALSSGDLSFVSRWRRGDTEIALRTRADGAYYRLFYVAQKVEKGSDPSRGILDLPAAKPQ